MTARGRFVLVLLLLAAAWLILDGTSTVSKIPIKQKLASFPQRIGEYRLSTALQSSAEVVELLGVDDYLQYDYLNAAGQRINLYVGYYGAVGVNGGYHSPKNCLPGGGWGIARLRDVRLAVGPAGASSSTVTEMLIQDGAEQQVVLYWYQNRGRIIASEYWEKFYLISDALLHGRRDGAFIRIMSYARDGKVEEAAARVKEFSELVLPALEHYLPGAQL